MKGIVLLAVVLTSLSAPIPPAAATLGFAFVDADIGGARP
jgi:hypothetical protein